MHRFEIEEDSSNIVLPVLIEDTRVDDGGGLTGLSPNTSELVCYYMRSGQGAPYCEHTSSSAAGDNGPTEISLTSSCAGQWIEGGFVEIDSDWMPGLYELQIPDACVASGAHTCHIQLRGADNMAVTNIQILVRSAVKANMAEISGDAAAADNLESTYDGSGYVDPVAPARQEQLDNLAIGSAAISVVAIGRTLTTGSEVNAYTDTATLNGISHEISDAAGTTDIYYEFNVGADGIPALCTVDGTSTGKNDDLKVFAWNWDASTWDQIGTMPGKAGSSAVEHQFTTVVDHVSTGATAGLVRIRFQNTGLTSATLYIDRILVSFAVVRRTVGYALGAIWVDTTNGTAGTEPFINGVADLPVSNWADALSLSTSLGLKSFRIAHGSSIVLIANSDDLTMVGDHWNLDLNGQSVFTTSVRGAHVVGANVGGDTDFYECRLSEGDALTVDQASFHECALTGSIVLTEAGTYYFDACYSGVAGTATPDIDFGVAVGNTNLNFRHYSGGIEIKNMGQNGDDKMSLEGHGQLVINASCTGGTIAIRGHFTVTDNADCCRL